MYFSSLVFSKFHHLVTFSVNFTFISYFFPNELSNYARILIFNDDTFFQNRFSELVISASTPM